GDVYRARTVVSGFGALSRPAYPSVPGLERFAGKTFHSATWDLDYDLRGKRVAVIGTGASAIQFVPQIAPQVAKLHVFQRTAPWVMHKPDRAITAFERFLFKHVPFTQVLFRATIYFLLELRVLGFKDANAMRIVQNLARRHIAKHIRDRGLRKKLTPTYTLGCKRILLSNDWYPALARENVEVVSDAIAEVREHSVVCADGSEREVDAIIYGTGFKVQEGVPQQLVFGTGGRDLAEVWSEGLRAYKGTTVAGFPNYFQLAGPNTGLGHSSMVYMIESQIAYTLDALKRMRKEGWASVEVKPEAQEAYCDRVQVGSSGSAWLSGCQSWYLDKHGRNTAIWPGFTFAFRREVRRFDAHAYITTGALRWTAAGKTKSPQSLEQAPASAAH
ncbi:MAG TPA: NAD(P)/FAD-dependent oxidoreductase, partial [Polyangiales bacterium]|nr:NAD(P)/FAD-dependent oxidoreductase [Polyangiales bacterium]